MSNTDRHNALLSGPTPEADTETVARVIHESDLRNGWSGHDRGSDAYNVNARALAERFHITERQQ